MCSCKMEPPNISVSISARWIRQHLDQLFGRLVPSSLVHEVRREVHHCLETSLSSGLSISVGEAVSVALDGLGYMAVEMPQRDNIDAIPE